MNWGEERQRRDVERQLDIMHLFQAHNGIMSELTALLRGMQVNGILWSGSVTIPAAGFVAFDHLTVPFAYAHVVNLGAAATMTFANRPPADVVPAAAVGVKKIVAGAGFGFNLVGNTATLYGTPGDVANVELHVKPDRATG